MKIIRMLEPAEINEKLVRVGSQNNGGYLLPGSALQQDVLVSPGVSWNSSFECTFADNGAVCHLFDASVEGPATEHKNFVFHKAFWGSTNTTHTIDAAEWISENIHSAKSNALQMDIEGAELEVVASLAHGALEKFKTIVIEVHSFQKVLDPKFSIEYLAFFQKLCEAHVVVHFHVNNNIRPVKYHGIEIPDCFELTLLRQDYDCFSGVKRGFDLHPFDTPCVADEEEVQINWGEVLRLAH